MAFLFNPILAVVGFTPQGVAAGSVAATWQASIGNVAAGSFFATLQSVGAGGSAAALLSPVGLVAVAGAGAVIGVAACGLCAR